MGVAASGGEDGRAINETKLYIDWKTQSSTKNEARAWPEPVMHDVMGLSRHLFDVLMELNDTAFTDEPGAPELVDHMPDLSTFVPVLD